MLLPGILHLEVLVPTPDLYPILVVDPTTLVRFRLQFLVLAVQPEQNQTLDLLISMENQQRGHLVPSLGE
jgi:hypothetical protein